MSSKITSILVWGLLAVLLAAGIYFFGLRAEDKQFIDRGGHIVDHTVQTIAEKTSVYEITAHYPEFSGIPTNEKEVNALIKELIDNEINSYKTDLNEAVSFDGTTTGIFNADTSVMLENTDLISVRFNISTYMSGAAHSFNYVKGLNIDVSKGKAIELGDIFTDDYLNIFSDLTRTKLLQARAKAQEDPLDQQQEQWIREGTDPREENFSSFVLGAQDITVIFNPYQVAPYAEGIIDVPIPYTDVKGIIKTESPVEYLLSR